MTDEQGPWIDTNPGPRNADRSQRKKQAVLQALQKAEGVCRIPHLS